MIFFSVSMYAQDISTNASTLEPSNESNTGFLDAFYEGEDAVLEEQKNENTALILFRIVFITVVLGFVTWLIIRFFFKDSQPTISRMNNSIEVLATIPAGLGNYFVIAKLYQSYYFLSLGTDGLRMLDKISDRETIDFIELNRENTLAHDTKFVDLLEKMPDGVPKKALEFLREKIDKLRKM
ncbi:hypothetical protein SAMN02745150_00235 [Brevinema andersonii]|uniref:Flagellar protein FliO/FliZ n=1 Tax=Brevinema andersonii TaxID=34097 RepID=A0A1I1D210_BREAD|nr:hypothetical protein [Brevinema andersonii]SFB69029.1 hypothetical protein SAMN02745150_00235 [Brevinema andersonii]